jgi:hypothetical protein
MYPSSFYVEKAPDNLQLELNDLQSDKELKEKFNSLKCAYVFELLHDYRYSNFKDFGKEILSMYTTVNKHFL